MKKSTLGMIIAVICTGLLVAIVLATKPESAQTKTNNASPSQEISAATVAEHITKEDCWMIISGEVYNVTEYVRNHPGGDDILRGCGKDATALFNTRRDENERVGSGTSHSSNARSTLESFKVGVLAN